MNKESMATGLFAADMDGTLILPDRGFHQRDIAALEALGEMGILRVVATGRSPFSFYRMMGKRVLPIDYLALSSGAAIQDYRSGKYLRSLSMTCEDTAFAVEILTELGYDFCLQRAIPENHVFTYKYTSESNPDMERRIAYYPGHCRPIRSGDENVVSTQIVVIVPPDRTESVLEAVTERLGDSYNVLRTTSPLDGESLWVEVFPRGISKSEGVAWIAGENGLTGKDCAAVGNDYNDHDLLEWVGSAFVVENSPVHLRTRFCEVPSGADGGVAEAARLWLVDRGDLSDEQEWP
ncbi:MAG: Cof-type HAD-IIB family hydrolase [Candidatus Aegiribacteria sp.]|nr:Cof-type HAD-IIB family hydrolase [Candidatus Aegiribacteria sp.]